MANRYWKNTTSNWNNANNWSAVSSISVDNAGVPTSSDPVIFDAGAAGTCTVDIEAVCNTLTFQNAGNKCSVSSGCGIRAAGGISLCSGMTLTAADATSYLSIYMASGGAVAYDCNTVTWGGTLWLYDNSTTNLTVTLSENASVSGFKITNASTGVIALNTNTLTVNGDLTPNADGNGSTVINWTGGNGKASDSVSTHRFCYPFSINGNVVIEDNFTIGGATARAFNYASGSPSIAAGVTLNVAGGIGWNVTYAQVPVQNMNITANSTFTMGQNSQIAGNFGGTGGLTLNGAYTFTCLGVVNRGSITASNVNTKIIITGGTSGSHSVWSRNSTTVHQVSIQLGVSGNNDYIDIDNGVSWGNAGNSLVTYADTTLAFTGAFTLFPTSCTLTGFNGANSFNNLNTGGTSGNTITLGSDLAVTGNWTNSVGLPLVISGNYNVSCANFNASVGTSNQNMTLKSSQTFTISNSITIRGAYGNALARLTLKSSSAGTKANLVYNGTKANCLITGLATTDIAGTGFIYISDPGTIATSTGITTFSAADIGGGGGGAGVSITNY